MIRRILGKLNRMTGNTDHFLTSYSQYGEDNIILTLLSLLQIKEINYLDIGANHPYKFSNTALLYKRGIRGINIEPDPALCSFIAQHRPEDVNLNVGIHQSPGELPYYKFDDSVYNTLSDEEAVRIQQKGVKLLDKVSVKVDTYNHVVQENLRGKAPVILFLDAEGLDEIIIDSIDFQKYAPRIICVETYSYGTGVKDQQLINKILAQGYTIHADTFVNTIFYKS
jgi:FkbM family methyltransferase